MCSQEKYVKEFNEVWMKTVLIRYTYANQDRVFSVYADIVNIWTFPYSTNHL